MRIQGKTSLVLRGCTCLPLASWGAPGMGRNSVCFLSTLGFPSGSDGKESTCNVGDLGSSLGWEDPLEEGTATHYSILAWRIHGLYSTWGLKSQTWLSDLHFQGSY